VQRIGWFGLAVLLLAAYCGLLRNGPPAHRTVVTANRALTVDRFARRDGPTTWVIEPTAERTNGSDFKLRIGSAVLKRVTIEAITPAVQDQALDADGVHFPRLSSALAAHISRRAAERRLDRRRVPIGQFERRRHD
jgi:hypothetical protein